MSAPALTPPITITDHDGDGCEDDSSEDTDDDNDGKKDAVDDCEKSPRGFISTSTGDNITDYDNDGCKDDDPEDTDDDNDGVLDASDTCSKGSLFTSNLTTDADGDGCNDDPTSKDGDPDGDGIRNSIDDDDDGDNIPDSEDVDYDNDGLIEIATATELNNIRYQLDGTSYKISANDAGSNAGCPTNNPVGCNGYELADNIDLSIADFVPIGNSIDEFSATLEGNDYAIRNLFIYASTRNAGLFTSLATGSTVQNLSFATGSIASSSGDNYVGVLAGTNSGAIFNVSADLSVSAGDGNDTVGGLVGKNSSTGTIVNSSATGTADGDAGNDQMGGLVGANEGTIQNSYATGNANGGGDSDYGIGGLIGVNEGTIQNSYATGNANGGADHDYVGGLVGFLSSGSIKNSYVLGNVDGGDGVDWVGYLVGGRSSGSIAGNYYNSESSRDGVGLELNLNNPEAVGKTSAKLKELTATTTEADFGASNRWNEFNWDFGTNTKYPSLKSYKTTTDTSSTQVNGKLLCGQPDPDFVQCTSTP